MLVVKDAKQYAGKIEANVSVIGKDSDIDNMMAAIELFSKMHELADSDDFYIHVEVYRQIKTGEGH